MGVHRIDLDESIDYRSVQSPDWFNDVEREYHAGTDEFADHRLYREDALKAVPDSYREAAEALGATRWQVVYRVLLPAAKNGLLAAVLLGAARSIGETMAVLMATDTPLTFLQVLSLDSHAHGNDCRRIRRGCQRR